MAGVYPLYPFISGCQCAVEFSTYSPFSKTA